MEKSLILKKRGDSAVLAKESVLSDSIVTVGSDPGATIALDDPAIAPEQFVVIEEGSETVLMNRASGTGLNGDALNPGARVALSAGDLIEAGNFVLLFGDQSLGRDTAMAPPDNQPGLAKAVGASAKNGKTSAAPKPVMSEPEEVDITGASSPVGKDPKQKKDFSKILSELKEEDTFYFHVRHSEDIIQRVPFADDLLWIGKKLGIVSIVEAQDDLDEVFARVNKDWSGVVVFPRTDRQICLNGEGLAQPARLRNEDVLQLVGEFETEEMATRITFHEPVSLLALSSILPGDLPAPVSPVEPEPDTGRFSEERNPDVADDALSAASNGPRLVFGYYTIMEIIVMAFGTLVTAAIIFFVLELV